MYSCTYVYIHIKTQFSSVKCEYDLEKRGRCGITSLKWSEDDDDEILRGFFSLCVYFIRVGASEFLLFMGKPHKNVSIIPFI